MHRMHDVAAVGFLEKVVTQSLRKAQYRCIDALERRRIAGEMKKFQAPTQVGALRR
jgi:hypothetical protein